MRKITKASLYALTGVAAIGLIDDALNNQAPRDVHSKTITTEAKPSARQPIVTRQSDNEGESCVLDLTSGGTPAEQAAALNECGTMLPTRPVEPPLYQPLPVNSL